jgi:ankyrin repeat protein
MKHWRLAVPALVLVSLFSTVTARAASRTQSSDDVRLPEAAQNGDLTQVQALLRAHVSVDSAEGDGSTALHWAAYQNNLALAQELLNAHANVNAGTRLESITPLYMACENGSAPMVELLLKHGANVNQADGLGTTPLMMAAAAGNAAVVKVLLDHGAEVNAKEQAHGQTALMFAANLDRTDVISVLLAHSADPNAATRVEKAIQEVSGSDQRQGAALDVKPKAGSASQKDGDKKEAVRPVGYERNDATLIGGMTPLLFAARQDNFAAVTALLDGGANINEVSGSEHTTPLVLAIMNGHFDLAKMLVERGADVNLANDQGVTPLWATEDVQYPPTGWNEEPSVAQEKTGYLSLMKLLLAHGENPNTRIKVYPWERVQQRDEKWIKDPGATAFFRAAQAWDVPAMKLLKDNGADPAIPTNQGTTPLMAAAGLGWAAMFAMTAEPTTLAAVQYLVGLGADVKAQDRLGYTALHAAAFMGQLKTIQYLVDHGADLNAKTKGGDTVADMANGPFEKSQLQPEAVALLVKLGVAKPHNCRSDACAIGTGVDVGAAGPPDVVAGSTTPAADSKTPTDVTLTTGKKPK